MSGTLHQMEIVWNKLVNDLSRTTPLFVFQTLATEITVPFVLHVFLSTNDNICNFGMTVKKKPFHFTQKVSLNFKPNFCLNEKCS